nr:hypothetical protein [Micromonospora sp. DSM 115978]
MGAGTAALVLTLALTGCGGDRAAASSGDWTAAPVTVDGLTATATVEGTDFLVHTAGGNRTFLSGVNLGTTTPGHQPGQLRVTAADFQRWFPMMREAGFRSVRVYTVMPPEFYTELRAYNL